MDFYVVLGVRREATDGDIRRAYKRLARQYHPDLNPGDREAAARFHDIAMAYETLTDADRRQRYDRGEPVAGPLAAAAGFTGFDFSPRVHAEPSTTFGDLFAEVFAPLAETRQARGADVHVDVTVDARRHRSGHTSRRHGAPRSGLPRVCRGRVLCARQRSRAQPVRARGRYGWRAAT